MFKNFKTWVNNIHLSFILFRLQYDKHFIGIQFISLSLKEAYMHRSLFSFMRNEDSCMSNNTYTDTSMNILWYINIYNAINVVNGKPKFYIRIY